MMIDYFNGCARARSLAIAAQIKIMGEPILIRFFIPPPSEKIQDYVMEEERV
jgi:hypothetical protein